MAEPPKTAKRDFLIEIEKQSQKRWEDHKAFEVNAPTIEEYADTATIHEHHPKFLSTTAYPYMNGRLHLGHGFTISKIEFGTGYQRLKGKRALFPLGWHCTGMPIRACADKLAREMEMFGKDFIIPKEAEEATPEIEKLNLKENERVDPTKIVAKKGKVAAKDTGLKYQFQIMEQIGVPREEIHKFADPLYWLSYFPPIATDDAKKVGFKIDFRRSFITTDANPFYDAFIRWQFNKLKALDKVKFGERYTIYSPKDGQPCMDHDRQSGEAVGPQDYTCIKLKVLEFSSEAKAALAGNMEIEGKKIFMVAATLRPETMYGQTNCFVGVDLKYGIFKTNKPDELFLMTERAARNMAFQKLSPSTGEVAKVADLVGHQLLGTQVKAPLSSYPSVYVLPMDGVLATKGTGVVTSVPSDSPDDYAAVMDLKKKPDYFKIQPEWIVPYEPIPIISTPTYGNLAAPTICAQMKINSQKDKTQLALAKDAVYKDGFYNGVLLIGEYANKPVQEAKPLIRQMLIDTQDAVPYNEPESLVISRSGEECVVALMDQWYLDYGETEWRKLAEECLENMNVYTDETKHAFQKNLDWLNQWACARSYGLGTRLPWDHNFLIESLSDSTIYMAYYTIAALLQGGSIDGSVPGPLGIKAEQLTDQVFEYIMADGPLPTDSDIPKASLDKLRREFEYFYPLDIRTSGKELIPNHLTFALYNHVALFPKKYWPRSIRVNGHLMLNGDKMSKSTGNFMGLAEAVEKYGADAARLALADAGDSGEDANFEDGTANAAILKLHTLLEWIQDTLNTKDQLRTGEHNFYDRVFESQMNKLINQAEAAYEATYYREAVMFAFYELTAARDFYREACALMETPMNKELIMRYIEVQTLVISPIVTHWSEHVWGKLLGKEGLVVNARWPKSGPVDEDVLQEVDYLRRQITNVRSTETQANKKKKKGKADVFDPAKPKKITILIASKFPEWQETAIEVLKSAYNPASSSENAGKVFDDDKIKKDLTSKGLLKDKKVMPFVHDLKKKVEQQGSSAFTQTLTFDEPKILADQSEYLRRILSYNTLTLVKTDEVAKTTEGDADQEDIIRAAEQSVPGQPTFVVKNIA
ncbi:cytosolic leucyl tRNA synthetase [Lobosporangium transversale]|uniref:leucine--tRNA ligase n=1 Tax=Lobosporangium transversale TaxID=64571 RepID=A0A1Y2H094_9FUNG|nr:leucine-tRNA ligase [Lobosporangium transversale]KAF9914119.1 cytosolic leucyl tRNA synthetase [Lobosporangium transversale]ORZ27978.1 leucine-tRNA ligase [Lobosporangium transversale]|eukprot:XP_021885681.1 leucine-tRNA ligase [Lobosporangium transversale]